MDVTSGFSQFRLFHLISPALPIGSFTYSQGLEWAIENEWINNVDDLTKWLESILKDSITWFDLPILIRLYDACAKKDGDQFSRWSQHLLAGRESKELRLEELNRARALLMVLGKLPLSQTESGVWPELFSWRDALLKSQAAGFALAANRWGIDREQMLAGYVWSWLENAVSVAIKLVPLGQSDGQAILFKLTEKLPAIIEQAKLIEDDDIGASTTALAIASSLHETQYTRLFRS